MLQIFGFLSGVLPMLGVIPYDRDIVRHKTKPHRGSFLIWSVLGGIAFFTQLAKGATWSLCLPAADTLATFSIFLLAIPYGVGGLSKRDICGLILAAIGLLLWYFTKQPIIALLLAVGVDAVGTVLTLIKTWEEPHSETFSSWLLAALGGLFAVFAVGKLSFALLVYPVYIFIANGAVNVIMLIRRPKQAA
ncbi:MAG TPA: hypothetical protein VJP80_02565 [Candidatus Saccharimonadales bacterium]|nr:hypothetical protein [Candidatus Saccharimonadales bacterium]